MRDCHNEVVASRFPISVMRLESRSNVSQSSTTAAAYDRDTRYAHRSSFIVQYHVSRIRITSHHMAQQQLLSQWKKMLLLATALLCYAPLCNKLYCSLQQLSSSCVLVVHSI